VKTNDYLGGQKPLEKTRLGKTRAHGHQKRGWAAFPSTLQPRRAKAILRRAYEGGINFYDTSNKYSDSEYKIGEALSDVRKTLS
jgi:aryl-alcohol dehydrogenase-like predicted oxidoreductase